MEFKMNRNASGYYDETAYKGMMGMAKPGEVWENGSKKVLIIKNHGNHSTSLLDEKKGDNCIAIMSDKVYYTDPSMLQYTFNDFIARRVSVLSSEGFREVVEDIELALGLDIGRKKAILDANARIRELEERLKEKQEEHTGDEGIYKRIYEDIINKLIDKKVM